MTQNADPGAPSVDAGRDLLPHFQAVCDEAHRLNGTTLHKEGFCLACMEVYAGLHLLALAVTPRSAQYTLPPNDRPAA